MYAVLGNVPLPGDYRRGKESKYPFTRMQVGEAFDADIESTRRVRAAIDHAQRTLGHRYTTRSIDGVLRVWRVE